jgi:hypothetical protein
MSAGLRESGRDTETTLDCATIGTFLSLLVYSFSAVQRERVDFSLGPRHKLFNRDSSTVHRERCWAWYQVSEDRKSFLRADRDRRTHCRSNIPPVVITYELGQTSIGLYTNTRNRTDNFMQRVKLRNSKGLMAKQAILFICLRQKSFLYMEASANHLRRTLAVKDDRSFIRPTLAPPPALPTPQYAPPDLYDNAPSPSTDS